MKIISILLIALSVFSTVAFSQGIQANVFTGFASPTLSKDLSDEHLTGVIVGAGIAKQFSLVFPWAPKCNTPTCL